jgi:Fic family protein
MARKYIHELVGWPPFTWDSKTLAPLLSGVRLHQGVLLGKIRGYGFASQWTATLKVLTQETIKSSAIEGVVLDPENVRCPSLAGWGWMSEDSRSTMQSIFSLAARRQ